MNKEAIIGYIAMMLNILVDTLTVEKLRELADKVIEFAEEAVANSETTIDDKLLGPILKKLDDAFGVPDED